MDIIFKSRRVEKTSLVPNPDNEQRTGGILVTSKLQRQASVVSESDSITSSTSSGSSISFAPLPLGRSASRRSTISCGVAARANMIAEQNGQRPLVVPVKRPPVNQTTSWYAQYEPPPEAYSIEDLKPVIDKVWKKCRSKLGKGAGDDEKANATVEKKEALTIEHVESIDDDRTPQPSRSNSFNSSVPMSHKAKVDVLGFDPLQHSPHPEDWKPRSPANPGVRSMFGSPRAASDSGAIKDPQARKAAV